MMITEEQLNWGKDVDWDEVVRPAADAYIQQQWTAYRATLTHTPTTTRVECAGRHGGGWDRWEWRGETQVDERAYCACCHRMVRGNVSPWAAAALADWQATPYMRRQQARWATAARRTALAWRRREVRTLGRRWDAHAIA